MKRGEFLEKTILTQQKKGKGILLVSLFIPCLLINQVLDNDIWFLLNSGRFVFENGIPTVEPFTIHEGLSFVMQQWMTASLFWTVYSKLGAIGLLALVIVLYALIVLFVFKICMLISENHFLLSYAITFIIGILISFFMVTRPYIISTLLIVIAVFCLESYIKTGKMQYLYSLPFLSMLQINIQAAMWPMLFVVLIPYWIDSFKFRLFFIRGQGYAKKPLLAATLLMLAAGFVNPYGYNAMVYLFKSYGYAEINRMVGEMQPANINTAIGKIIFASMAIVILTYCLYKKGDSTLRYTLFTFGMGVLALSSLRGFLFFAIFAFFPLSRFLRDINFNFKGEMISSSKRQNILRTLLIILICAGLVGGFVYKNRKANENDAGPEGARQVDYLLKTADPETTVLYTSYNAGGYAEYMGYRCYLDPRAEVFVRANNKKADIISEYFSLQTGQLYYRDFLDKYAFTHLLVPSGDILFTYLANDSDFKIVYEDDDYRVFVPVG